MQAIRTLTLMGCLFFSSIVIFSCKKAELHKKAEVQSENQTQALSARPAAVTLVSSVSLSVPSQVTNALMF